MQMTILTVGTRQPAWVDAAVLGHVSVIEIDPSEPYAANGLLVGGRLVYHVDEGVLFP